eukprot:6343471-Pyramimonas_sp.AAC.1
MHDLRVRRRVQRGLEFGNCGWARFEGSASTKTRPGDRNNAHENAYETDAHENAYETLNVRHVSQIMRMKRFHVHGGNAHDNAYENEMD